MAGENRREKRGEQREGRTNGRVHFHLMALLAAVAVANLSAPPANAEVFSDIYLGVAITGDSTYTQNGEDTGTPWTCIPNCGSAVSPLGGMRIGYWLDPLPWLGFAGDFSAFVAGWGIESPVDVTAFPLSALVAVRGRLVKRENYPNGRVQPYAAVGMSLVTSWAEDTEGIYDSFKTYEDTSFDVGLDTRVGAKIMGSDWIGVFLEYRYTYFRPSWKLQGNTIATELGTSHFILGLGIHY